MKKHWKPICAILLLAAVVGGCAWYARPVDIYTLMPGLEPDTMQILVTPGQDAPSAVCGMVLTAGDPAFDQLLSRLEELRFRRSVLNPLAEVSPLFSGPEWPRSKTPESGEIETLDIRFSQPREISHPKTSCSLMLWVDTWGYRDLDHDSLLSCSLQGGRELGQALARDFQSLSVSKMEEQRGLNTHEP